MMHLFEFVEFATKQHDDVCNQKYDRRLPYSCHLEFVASQAMRFKHLLNQSNNDVPHAAMGCWGHDLIEDARLTYNDIKDKVGVEVAEIIYACTEVKGRNRDARHSVEYYADLNANRLAVFVKLCDIMANVKYSILTNSSMYEKHKKEHAKTLKYLYDDHQEFKPMFDHLTKLFAL